MLGLFYPFITDHADTAFGHGFLGGFVEAVVGAGIHGETEGIFAASDLRHFRRRYGVIQLQDYPAFHQPTISAMIFCATALSNWPL